MVKLSVTERLDCDLLLDSEQFYYDIKVCYHSLTVVLHNLRGPPHFLKNSQSQIPNFQESFNQLDCFDKNKVKPDSF